MYTIPHLTGSDKQGWTRCLQTPTVLVMFSLHKRGQANAKMASLGHISSLITDEATADDPGPSFGMEAMMVLDMGTHTLRHLPGQHLLVQLLVPGLEERARILPALVSAHSTPGAPS